MNNLKETLQEYRYSSGAYWFDTRENPEHIDAEVAAAGYDFLYINGSHLKNGNDLLDYVGSAFRFPEYFGGTWDGFYDLLSDLTWNSIKRYVLLYDQADVLARSSPADFLIAFQCMQDAALTSADAWRRYVLLRGDLSFLKAVLPNLLQFE